jgi:hypothetical protein
MRPPCQLGVQEIREYLSHLYLVTLLVHRLPTAPNASNGYAKSVQTFSDAIADEVNRLDPTGYALDLC